MKSAKEIVRKMLKGLPENSSLEDIQYHIYVREKIERGLDDIRKGHVVSQKDAEKRMQKWLLK